LESEEGVLLLGKGSVTERDEGRRHALREEHGDTRAILPLVVLQPPRRSGAPRPGCEPSDPLRHPRAHPGAALQPHQRQCGLQCVPPCQPPPQTRATQDTGQDRLNCSGDPAVLRRRQKCSGSHHPATRPSRLPRSRCGAGSSGILAGARFAARRRRGRQRCMWAGIGERA
jgi:hypothetical protein